jgi:hypothetical protein
MERKEYNGWTNYETWNVKLWMDNDSADQAFWEEETEHVCNHCRGDKFMAIHKLAKQIKDAHLEAAPEVTGTYADLLGAALSEVNWYEIAEHMVDDYASENPEVFETEEEES